MTIMIKIMMLLTIIKWLVGLIIIPISQLVLIINDIGEPNFYVGVLLRTLCIILSISFVNYFHFEVFLNKEEHKWINDEIKRIRNLKQK